MVRPSPEREEVVEEPVAAWVLERRGEVLALLECARPAPRWPAGVTDAEIAVAELLAAGLTNAEVAERRGTSARTVANQAASLYRKLGVGSRAGLVAWLFRCPGTGP